MKKELLIASILVCLSLVGYSQSAFHKAFGGNTDDYGYALQHTQDGNIIVAGRSLSYGVGQYDLYLIKMTTEGDTLWSRTYGNINYDEAFDVDTTSDGGLIVCGKNSTSDWAGDLFLMKLNANGTMAWSKTYGSTVGLADTGYGVKQTSDGGFIATGSTASFGSGGSDVYVIKTNATGVVEWTRTIGGSGDDVGRDVLQTSNGDYYVGGYTDSYGSGFLDIYFIKLTSSGTVSWTKVYGGGSYDFAYTVEQTTDGGFVLGATTNSYGEGDMEALLVKTNVSGTLEWAKAYGRTGEDRSQVAKQTSDGGYILAGRTNSFGAGNYDSYLVKTTSDGTFSWDMAQGGGSWDQAWDVIEMADNGFTVAGLTISYGQGGRSVYVYRTDASGLSGCNENSGSGTVTTSVSMSTTTGGNSSSGGTAEVPPVAIRTGSIVDVECESSGPCPSSDFSASATDLCEGETVDFTNESVNSTTYQWLLDESPFATTENAQLLFDEDGEFEVGLVAESANCDDTSFVTITVGEPATAEAGSTQVICEGNLVQLDGSFGGGASSGTWSTGGDGDFNNETVPNTIYDPSVNDESNGTVMLYFETNDPDGGCNSALDSVLITIDLCVGINSPNTVKPKEIGRFDILGRPISKDASFSIILYDDGTRKKLMRIDSQ